MSDRLLLCTDLDRTLIPNGPQPESPGARRIFRELCAIEPVTLVYVTGRHRSLVQQAIVNYVLPVPDYVVGDVGTSIYRVDSERRWEPLSEWERRIGERWPGRTSAEIRDLFADLNGLRLQEHPKQNRYKVSFYVSLFADRAGLDSKLRARLADSGIHADLVWSVDEPAGIGLLDVLPASASKFHAIEYLMRNLGFDTENTMFSGDSGNDMEVLVSPIPAVLVANASAAVKYEALRRASVGKNLSALYLAKGGFLQLNGNYSAGILEGIANFHPRLVEQLISREKGLG